MNPVIRPAHFSELTHLIDESTLLMQSLYPEESNHLVDPADLGAQGNVLLGAAELDTVIGCVGFVDCGDYAEVKRLFVSQEFRGHGIARALMAELEHWAVNAGHTLMRLETGIHQPDAVALFESLQYQIRTPFGDYLDDPLSVFMEKTLA